MRIAVGKRKKEGKGKGKGKGKEKRTPQSWTAVRMYYLAEE